MKKFGPCKIVKRHDSRNAYEVELLAELNISPLYNILDLNNFLKEVMVMRLQIYSGVLRKLLQIQRRFRRYWTVMLVEEQGKKPTKST